MGFLGLGIVLLLVGILLIMLVTRMTARNLKLTLHWPLFSLLRQRQ